MSGVKGFFSTLRDCLKLNRSSKERDVDVIIHIGAPKTGSSAIQRFCLNNRKPLAHAGYYYPKHSVDKNGVSGGHSVIGNLLKDNKISKANFYFKLMLLGARLRRKTLLISSESFFRNALGFQHLLDGLNVRVVGWFRHPAEAFISNYNQSVKRHFRTETVSQVFAKTPANRRPASLSGKRLYRWADLVGDERCTFLPYRKSSADSETKTIERVWLELLNMDPALINRFEFDAKRVNRSYVHDALELKRLLNVVLIDADSETGTAIDWALQNYSDKAEDSESELGAYLESEQIKSLCANFAATNRRLAKRFPALQPLLAKDEVYLNQAKVAVRKPLNLEKPLEYVASLCPGEINRIRQEVKIRSETSNKPSEELRELERLLGVVAET